MVIVNAPLRADMFRTKAEGIGLTFVSKTGMKMSFSVPAGEDEAAKAAELNVAAAVEGVPVPFHPGAARYYAECGYEVEAGA